MKLSKLVITSAFVAVAMGLASGTVNAAPAPAPETPGDAIGYESHLEDRAIVTTIDAGVFKIADDGKTVDLLDAKDAVVVTLPLSFNLGGLNFPYEKNLADDGKTLRLVPQMDLNKASLRSSDLPSINAVASTEENLLAQETFASQLGIASAIGGFTGTAIGAVIVGIATCIPTALLGCLPGIASGAAVGGIIGTIIAGGPTLVIAGLDLINTLNAAPGTTKFADSTK